MSGVTAASTATAKRRQTQQTFLPPINRMENRRRSVCSMRSSASSSVSRNGPTRRSAFFHNPSRIAMSAIQEQHNGKYRFNLLTCSVLFMSKYSFSASECERRSISLYQMPSPTRNFITKSPSTISNGTNGNGHVGVSDLFVGRKWLIREILEHFADNLPTNRGFVVSGEAGTGKTALIRHIANKGKYILFKVYLFTLL